MTLPRSVIDELVTLKDRAADQAMATSEAVKTVAEEYEVSAAALASVVAAIANHRLIALNQRMGEQAAILEAFLGDKRAE